MSAMPFVVLLMVLGFINYGMVGMAWGAGLGWACSIAGAAIGERQRLTFTREMLGHVEALRKTQTEMMAAVSDLGRVSLSVLDALPVDHFDQMDMHTPRTQEKWEAADC